MKKYIVSIPIAGHFIVEVKAENEEQAIERAWAAQTGDGEVEWEQLNRFHEGNVCHCPHPREVEAEEVDDD